jgi:predicted nucleotidyltransferase
MHHSPASASRLRGIFVCISGILWYNIGREFPIGGVRMNTLSRTEIEQVIRELLHKYHAEYALLFGSYARGEATAASDIDVIVVGGANFRPRDIFAFGEELRQRTQKDVDAFEIREVNTGTPFYESIMREGVRIA